MANPTSFTFDPVAQTFTFTNGHISIVADTTIVPPPPATPPESVTINSVTLTFDNPGPHDSFTLPITNVVVPPPVVDHVFSLF
jgi:hypothetical protein